MCIRQAAQFFTTLVLSMLAATSRADTDDQQLKQALSGLAETTAKLKVSVEVLKGGKVFETYCLACHSPEVRLPSIAQSPLMRESNADLVKFVLFSKKGAKHPGWHMALTPIDVSNVVNFLQVAFKKDPIEFVSPESVVTVIASYYQGSKVECTPSK